MIREVTMYRVECSEDGCNFSPHDETDHFAWSDVQAALDCAVDADWYIGEFGEFCEDHSPRCICGIRFVNDDDYDAGLCEDCAEAVLEVSP